MGLSSLPSSYFVGRPSRSYSFWPGELDEGHLPALLLLHVALASHLMTDRNPFLLSPSICLMRWSRVVFSCLSRSACRSWSLAYSPVRAFSD
jgi:hypothetical protein